MPSDVEAESMPPAPAVRCSSCDSVWNSAAMADGLRLLGCCPRCSGELAFADQAHHEDRFDVTPASRADAPHLVLGIPRR